jgi:hypothetical protein
LPKKLGALERAKIALEKLNGMAISYYWGEVSFKTTELGRLELRILSRSFVGPELKEFYDSIYQQFMRLVGFKLAFKNELTNCHYFEPIEVKSKGELDNG